MVGSDVESETPPQKKSKGKERVVEVDAASVKKRKSKGKVSDVEAEIEGPLTKKHKEKGKASNAEPQADIPLSLDTSSEIGKASDELTAPLPVPDPQSALPTTPTFYDFPDIIDSPSADALAFSNSDNKGVALFKRPHQGPDGRTYIAENVAVPSSFPIDGVTEQEFEIFYQRHDVFPDSPSHEEVWRRWNDTRLRAVPGTWDLDSGDLPRSRANSMSTLTSFPDDSSNAGDIDGDYDQDYGADSVASIKPKVTSIYTSQKIAADVDQQPTRWNVNPEVKEKVSRPRLVVKDAVVPKAMSTPKPVKKLTKTMGSKPSGSSKTRRV